MRIIILFLVIVFFSSCTAKTVQVPVHARNAKYVDKRTGVKYSKYDGTSPYVVKIKRKIGD